MFNAKNILANCLLAAALAGSALTAMAASVTSYHVDVDTTGMSGTGAFDFYLASSAGAALPLTATLSNFSSNFGAVDTVQSGDYTANADGSFALTNGSGYNFLLRSLTLGGAVGFDVNFSGAFLDTVGSEDAQFSSFLYGADGTGIGNEFGLVVINLKATAPTIFTVAPDATGLSTVTAITASAVPEPSAMLMMLTGLGLVGFTARRRKAASR